MWKTVNCNGGFVSETYAAQVGFGNVGANPVGVFNGALLAMLVLLFGFQGGRIVHQPLVIVLLAVPILIQVYFNASLAYLLNRIVRSSHCVAGPSALIGASNFFELAVATAIALFGFKSGAALATVVGVLVEVPVMLSAVAVVNRTRHWYEMRAGVVPNAQCCPASGSAAPGCSSLAV